MRGLSNVYDLVQRLWKYSKDAVELHLDFLSTAVKGAETHSVIVTDIPGTYAGPLLRLIGFPFT